MENRGGRAGGGGGMTTSGDAEVKGPLGKAWFKERWQNLTSVGFSPTDGGMDGGKRTKQDGIHSSIDSVGNLKFQLPSSLRK